MAEAAEAVTAGAGEAAEANKTVEEGPEEKGRGGGSVFDDIYYEIIGVVEADPSESGLRQGGPVTVRPQT